MTEALKVFLCYASQDRSAVQELYNSLKTQDWVDPWLDKAKILPGQDWRVVIEEAVEEADIVIACLSTESVNKEGFVQRELKYATEIAEEKPGETIFLIPLRLDECMIPRWLRHLQWNDYFGAEKSSAFSNLLAALKLRYEQKYGITGDDRAHRLDEEKARKEEEERHRASQNRILEAAIEKQVSVGVPTSLFVWIKRVESKSIISVVSSIDEDLELDEDNVRSKGLEIEFPIENGRVLVAGISLKLVAHDFTPSAQEKKIIVPPDGDSEVYTFIVTPNKTGRLLLNLEVLKEQVSIATRTLHTTATASIEKKNRVMILVSIPIVVLVQPKTNENRVSGNTRVKNAKPDGVDKPKQKKSERTTQPPNAKTVSGTSPVKSTPHKKKSKLDPAVMAAIIGVVGTILASLITIYAGRQIASSTVLSTNTVTPTSTITETPPPTDTITPELPTVTLAPVTITPIPTATSVLPVPIGKPVASAICGSPTPQRSCLWIAAMVVGRNQSMSFLRRMAIWIFFLSVEMELPKSMDCLHRCLKKEQ